MNVQRFMCSTAAAVTAALALATTASAGGDTVTLSANACYKVGDTVVVTISKDVTGTAVAGGQFFLSYDTSKLSYVSGAAGDAPFTTTIYSASGVGTVDFAVGVPMPANATTAAGVMARLTFTATGEVCAGSNLVTFRTPPSPFPPSRLTDVLGAVVPATFGNLGAMTIDSTLPVIGYCPPNITINCDVAPTPANTLGPATATDNCGVPTVTYSDSTITSVTPSNLGDWDLFATSVLSNSPGGDGVADFVNGPATPPLGTGSAHLNTGSLGDQSAQMRNDAWAGTMLSALTELSYSTYGTSWNGPLMGSGGQMTYLTLYIDLNGDLTYDDRIFFEPEYSQAGYGNPFNMSPQPGPVLGVWQTWNCMTGMWYGDSFAGPGVDARPLSMYIAANPTARIVNANPTQGGIRIAAGFASPSDVFNVYVDNFRIATASSSAVYNFELNGFPCSDEIITRTWKATDCAGNFSTCSQTITRHDSTPPMITCPGPVSVNADAGFCTHTFGSFAPATATDNCSSTGQITITYLRSDNAMLTLADPFPSGLTTITWRATDCAGNYSECPQTVTVASVNILNATVELANVNLTTFDRCITFQFFNIGSCPGAPVTVDAVMTFTGRVATAAIAIPCGSYDCVTATDRLHTLRMTANSGHFGISGVNYVATFINDVNGDDRLPGGNLNNDPYVDILDFGAFIGQLGVTYGSVNTTCSTVAPHADINGDGTVNGLDYSFVSTNFLHFREADCCGVPLVGDGGPITDITVFDLAARDWDIARVADVNRDGRVNMNDVIFVAINGKGLCATDYDNRNGVAIDDLFSYINGYFTGHPAADSNADRAVRIDDLFHYVNDWFVGCN